MNATKFFKRSLITLFIVFCLSGCGGSALEPIPEPTTSPPETGITTPSPVEIYKSGEPVPIHINDTIEVCEDHLHYAIVQVIGEKEREVALTHSCLGIAGSGVDSYCRNGQVEREIVVTCSDVMLCDEKHVNKKFNWDQQEFVQISEDCAGEIIYREIQQQVPGGTYRVIVRYLEGEQVKTRVVKEFIIESDEPGPLLLFPGKGVSLGAHIPETHRIAFDVEGVMHLVWQDSRGVWHRPRMPDGVWIPEQNLSENFEVLYGLVDLVLNPAGQACVFFDAAKVSTQPSSAGLYMRCLEGNEWSPAGDRIPGQYAPTFSPAVDFAPDGELHLLHATGPGNAPVQLNGQNLSSDQGVIFDLAFEISPAGGYHVLWQRQSNERALEYRYSGAGGEIWAEIENLTGWPLLSTFSLVVDNQDDVHMAGWGGAEGVYYQRRIPGGEWEPAVLVSGDLAGGAKGDFAIGPDRVAHIIWENDLVGGGYYVRQLETGTWSQPLPLTIESVKNIHLAIDSGGGLHFVWQGGDGGLYYASE